MSLVGKDKDLMRGLGVFIARQLASQLAILKLGNEVSELPDEMLNKDLRDAERNLIPSFSWFIRRYLPSQIPAENSEGAKAFLQGLGIGIAQSGTDPVLLVRSVDQEGERFLEALPPSVAVSFQFAARGTYTDEERYAGKVLVSRDSKNAVRSLNENGKIVIASVVEEYKRRSDQKKQRLASER